MPVCATSVTTPTGVFTYFDKEITVCEAKIECANRGQILAPVTNWDDLDALRSIGQNKDPSCKFHRPNRNDLIARYHVGLDVTICGNKQYRLFTNNVVWNKTEHRNLYKFVGEKDLDINIASYSPRYRKVFIINGNRKKDFKQRFICLKPNATSSYVAEPLIEKDVVYHPSSNVLYACAAFIVALVGGVLMLNLKKKRQSGNDVEVKKLKKEIECLKKKLAATNDNTKTC